jgi:hypothetical protein
LACNSITYVGHSLFFHSFLGFSQYDADGNAPDFNVGSSSITTSGVTLTVTSNEEATCRKSSSDQNFDSMADSNLAVNLTGNWNLSGLSAETTYTYYVQCRDLAGNDSNKSVSVTTNSNAPGGSGASVGGTGTTGEGTTTTTTTVVGESSETYTPTQEQLQDLLGGLVGDDGTPLFTSEEIAEILANAGDYTFERTMKVEQITNTITGEVSYKTTFTISIVNTTNTTLENVKVVEVIPKAVAQSASDISSLLEFSILAADPVIEFIIPSLAPGESYDLNYSINEKLDQNVLSDFNSPLIISAELEEAPSEYNPPAEETPPVIPQPDYTMPIIALLVIVVVIALAYMLVSKKTKKSKK